MTMLMMIDDHKCQQSLDKSLIYDQYDSLDSPFVRAN